MNKRIFTCAFVLAGIVAANAQFTTASQEYWDELRTITTAVPFLTVSPDARSGALADAGVASTPDANSIHWNAAKMAFLEDDATLISMSYVPWLRRLAPDIDLAYLSFHKKISKNAAIGSSLRYFSMGEITFRDEQGNSQGTFNPYEFAADIAVALKLSQSLSGAIALRYIFSDLTQGQTVIGLDNRPGVAFGSDISLFYDGRKFNLPDGRTGRVTAGMNISNLGNKIAYTESVGGSDFLPANFRLGAGFHYDLDQYNQFSLLFDVNRLLVPSRPIRDPQTGEVLEGMDDDVPPLQGAIQSFYDAPGGFREEMRETGFSVAAEYWYDKTFAARFGYRYEHPTKGNRRYFTMGAGIKFSAFTLDLAYLLPASATVSSPLESTLRFTLSFDINGFNSMQ